MTPKAQEKEPKELVSWATRKKLDSSDWYILIYKTVMN